MNWRCFHCNENCETEAQATEHFGTRLSHEPACQIDIAKYRQMERLHERAVEEDTDTDRRMYAMQSEHSLALRREEEKGYARGLADARKHPEDLGLMVKP